MRYVPNLLSLLRLVFIPFLFYQWPILRAVLITLAMCTDVLDGYLARRWKQESRFGIILDPLTDKIFVAAALGLFFIEGSMTWVEISIFLLRDVSLVAFALWMYCTGASWTVRSFFCGKVMTSMQFIVLFLVALDMHVSWGLFVVMAVFGVGSFFELLRRQGKSVQFY